MQKEMAGQALVTDCGVLCSGTYPQGCQSFGTISPNIVAEESGIKDDSGMQDVQYTEVGTGQHHYIYNAEHFDFWLRDGGGGGGVDTCFGKPVFIFLVFLWHIFFTYPHCHRPESFFFESVI